MKNKIKIEHLLLFLILITAFMVRIYSLSNIPSGFFGDEAAIGYNAYSILHTGKDEYGVTLPLFFRSFGDFKPGIAIYSSIPFVALLGLTEDSVRMQSVFYGIITLIAIYLIAREIFSTRSALLATAIGACMPWMIHYNRTGFELNSYAAFFTLSVFLFIKSSKNKKYIIPSFVISALTLYTYYSAKLIVPLFLIGMFIIFRKEFLKYKRMTLFGLSLFALISIPVIQSFFTGEGLARFNAVSVFSAKLSFSDTILKILNNYFLQISPSLFLLGEPTPITRHFTRGLTPFLVTTLPFFYVGIFYILNTWKKKSSQVLLWWLLLYPIGAAVVADAPFTGRTVIGASLGAILISIGISKTIKYGKKIFPKVLLYSAIGGILLINFVFFLRFYFVQYPAYSSGYWGWQYGPSEIVRFFIKNEDNYDEEFMMPEFNAPYIFFRFYAPNGCTKCRLGTPNDSYNPQLKQLFAVTPTYLQQFPTKQFTIRKIIYYPDRTTAFILGDINR